MWPEVNFISTKATLFRTINNCNYSCKLQGCIHDWHIFFTLNKPELDSPVGLDHLWRCKYIQLNPGVNQVNTSKQTMVQFVSGVNADQPRSEPTRVFLDITSHFCSWSPKTTFYSFSSSFALYLALSTISSTLSTFAVQAEEKHPESMIPTPPCFTVELVCLGWCPHFARMPKKNWTLLVLSTF